MTQRELIRLLKASIKQQQSNSTRSDNGAPSKGATVTEILLTNGMSVYLDSIDLPLVAAHRWYLSANKYAAARLNGRDLIYMHRLFLDPKDGEVVDHIDGNGLNNTRANLRICSHKSNIRAMRTKAPGYSQFRGVSFDRSRDLWTAKITVDGHTINLGRFQYETDAAAAYRSAAIEHFGNDYRPEVTNGRE